MIRSRTGGFSLIEAMVAIAVLGVILVAVGGLMTGNLQVRRASNISTEAVQLATSYLESIKRTWSVLDDYVALPGGQLVLPPPPTDPRGNNYTFVLNFRCLTVTGTYYACATDRNPELRQVSIDVINSQDQTVAQLISQIGRPFEPRSNR